MSTKNKQEKFVDLATKRVNKTIKELRLVANLSNRRNYDYTDEQATKIVKALQKELDAMKQAFMSTKDEGGDEFKL